MEDSYVTSGATMKCSCGDKTARLTVYPDRTVFLTGKPMANISDHVSMYNIWPFGKCRTTSYPATGSATAANQGVLTPMPCVPGTMSEWLQGKSDYIIKGKPALLKSSYCKCQWGGIITITDDGQTDTGDADLNRVALQSEEEWTAEELKKEGLTPEDILDGIQTSLDLAGFFPGLGAIPDLLNAAIYALRGDMVNAGLSVAAAVPGIGDAAAGAKLIGKGVKAAKATKKADKVADAAKAVGKTDKAAEVGKTSNKTTNATEKGVTNPLKSHANHSVQKPDMVHSPATSKNHGNITSLKIGEQSGGSNKLEYSPVAQKETKTPPTPEKKPDKTTHTNPIKKNNPVKPSQPGEPTTPIRRKDNPSQTPQPTPAKQNPGVDKPFNPETPDFNNPPPNNPFAPKPETPKEAPKPIPQTKPEKTPEEIQEEIERINKENERIKRELEKEEERQHPGRKHTWNA